MQDKINALKIFPDLGWNLSFAANAKVRIGKNANGRHKSTLFLLRRQESQRRNLSGQLELSVSFLMTAGKAKPHSKRGAIKVFASKTANNSEVQATPARAEILERKIGAVEDIRQVEK